MVFCLISFRLQRAAHMLYGQPGMSFVMGRKPQNLAEMRK